MRIAVASDDKTGIAGALVGELERRGHELSLHGALGQGHRADWARCSARAASEVPAGQADFAIVCCWTGTGASIAANKIDGVRAALCVDSATAAGARRWNDANVLAISLRTTSEPVMIEILDAWFETEASTEPKDLKNIAYLAELS